MRKLLILSLFSACSLPLPGLKPALPCPPPQDPVPLLSPQGKLLIFPGTPGRSGSLAFSLWSFATHFSSPLLPHCFLWTYYCQSRQPTTPLVTLFYKLLTVSSYWSDIFSFNPVVT